MVRPTLELTAFQNALKKGLVFWTGHAKKQLLLRNIKRSEVHSVIAKGSILEKHPRELPYPKCLLMGFVRKKEPLYVSLAFDGTHVTIITVHWMDKTKWINPWTRRTL